MPRLPSSSVWSPGRISSIREHGSQTIVISNSAPPTRNRWPTGHVRTSSPSIVKFSRMRPYSRPSASRCSAEANSTCRLVPGRACAHPSRPCSSRSEEHTSELQSRQYLVCRLLLEKKKKKILIILLDKKKKHNKKNNNNNHSR